MFTYGQFRSSTTGLIGVILTIMLLISFDQSEAIPLSRYGRANLARYGKRSEAAGRPGAEYFVESANSKGVCKYTGVGELYWCQFANTQTSGDFDETGL